MNSAEKLIYSIIKKIGEDPERPALIETPKRVVRSWSELFGGYRKDPSDLLKTFDEPFTGMILAKGIKFHSTCEHHMLPFSGVGHIAYIPSGKKVVGASKLARLLDLYSRRLQIQERIAEQVVVALMKHINPSPTGAACILEAKHSCMLCRGVKSDSSFVVSVFRGSFLTDQGARNELLQLIGHI